MMFCSIPSKNDCRHFSAEEDPNVRVPDLIVVSGDIVQGIQADALEPEKSLREQYAEASVFLTQLADRFVGGDRERNAKLLHDLGWRELTVWDCILKGKISEPVVYVAEAVKAWLESDVPLCQLPSKVPPAVSTSHDEVKR